MDGTVDPRIGRPVLCIKGGDDLIPAISAASIVAKVTRDRFMAELAEQFPVYGWQQNAGYPTKAHKEALLRYGISPHHRLEYGPVKALVG
jgi:ribonuclease HII